MEMLKQGKHFTVDESLGHHCFDELWKEAGILTCSRGKFEISPNKETDDKSKLKTKMLIMTSNVLELQIGGN